MVLTLKASPREILGKKIKSFREKGLLPAVIYGAGENSKPIALNLKEFERVWSKAGESSIIELEIGGDKKNVLIAEVQRDPLKDVPIHADFQVLRMDEKIEAEVPINFIGESPAVKNLGGVLVKVLHELEIEALPADLPAVLEVDISGLANLDDRFLVKDLKLPNGVKVLASSEEVIILVEEPKAEEIPVEAPTLEDIEVVGKKGKKEEEGALTSAEGEAGIPSAKRVGKETETKPQKPEKK